MAFGDVEQLGTVAASLAGFDQPTYFGSDLSAGGIVPLGCAGQPMRLIATHQARLPAEPNSKPSAMRAQR
jgi:hypothetical protein